MARVPRQGDVLRSDDGSAIVVNADATQVDGLLDLIEAEYGGDRFASTNPVIVAAATEVRIEVWRSCTKAWREAEGIDVDAGWWSPEGDGRRSITVAYYDGNAYMLGEAAEQAEQAEARAGDGA